MKKFASVFLAILLCAQPQAEAAGVYWGGRLLYSGVNMSAQKLHMAGNYNYPAQSFKLPNSDYNAYGLGYLVGIDLGWAGNIPIRLEADLTISKGGTYRFSGTFATEGPIRVATIKTDLSLEYVLSESTYIWLDIPVGDFPFKPYIGGGMTLSFYVFDAEIVLNKGTSGMKEDRDLDYSASWDTMIGGGVRYAVGKRTFLDLSVRKLLSDVTHTIWVKDWDVDFKTDRFEASLGLSYYF